MTHRTSTLFASSAYIAFFQRLVADFRTRRAQRLEFDRVYGELQLLTNSELVEYGMHRSDFHDIACEAVYRV